MTVTISPNIKIQKAMVNMNGDEVVPFTHRVIRSANEGNYTPTQAEREALQSNTIEAKGNTTPVEQENPTQAIVAPHSAISPLTIQQEIEQAEAHLASLKLKKAEQIALMKKQLEMLESE